jgi:hypothetical protein
MRDGRFLQGVLSLRCNSIRLGLNHFSVYVVRDYLRMETELRSPKYVIGFFVIILLFGG